MDVWIFLSLPISDVETLSAAWYPSEGCPWSNGQFRYSAHISMALFMTLDTELDELGMNTLRVTSLAVVSPKRCLRSGLPFRLYTTLVGIFGNGVRECSLLGGLRVAAQFASTACRDYLSVVVYLVSFGIAALVLRV